MKLINFIYRLDTNDYDIKSILMTLENTGIIDRWAYMIHEVVKGALVPHCHVYVSQVKEKSFMAFLSKIDGGDLIGTVQKEKDILLYMMRHGKCDTANIIANFDVEKAIFT